MEVRLHPRVAPILRGYEREQPRHVILFVAGRSRRRRRSRGGTHVVTARGSRVGRHRRRVRGGVVGPARGFQVHPRHHRETAVVERPRTADARAQHPAILTVQLEHPRRASALRQRERGVELVKHDAAAGTRERRARREPHPEVADRHVMRRDQPSAPP